MKSHVRGTHLKQVKIITLNSVIDYVNIIKYVQVILGNSRSCELIIKRIIVC